MWLVVNPDLQSTFSNCVATLRIRAKEFRYVASKKNEDMVRKQIFSENGSSFNELEF